MHATTTRTADATVEPVTLAEAKTHLREELVELLPVGAHREPPSAVSDR